MRIAALYDIHANLPALEAVLDEIRDKDVDLVLIGGDVVAGPLPNETLECLRTVDLPMHFILGNAESDVLRHLAGKDIGGLSARADEEARWVAAVLSDEHKDFIKTWTPTFELDMETWGKVLFCHATPLSDVDIFTRLTPDEKLLPVFEAVTASLVVCGHTHMQFERLLGERRIVNAGSLGMRFGGTGADWLMIDKTMRFMHTDYELNEAAERIRASAYPHAEAFVTGNVLSSPPEDKMLAMLTQMEVAVAPVSF